MVFILFERKIFIVSVAFCLIKIYWVVPGSFVTLPVLIFFNFYFPSDFPGLNIKSFRDLV